MTLLRDTLGVAALVALLIALGWAVGSFLESVPNFSNYHTFG